MIGNTIAERQNTKSEVQSEISQNWASQQTILGPVLAVPYKHTVNLENEHGQKQVRTSIQLAYILPQQFQVDSELKPEVRSRGIYQSIVYTSYLKAQGAFNLKAIEELGISNDAILWKDAFMVLGVPCMKGINQKPAFLVQGKVQELLPGVNGVSFINSGLYTPVSVLAGQTNIPFSLSLALRGNESYSIIPVGK